MKKLFVAMSAALVAVSSMAPAVVLVSKNFETNQSADFTVTIASSTNDASANFTYDSSTHVAGSNSASIVPGSAPSDALSTTNVLRLNANLADATDNSDAVNVYPTVSGLTSDWYMTFDAWQNYNGPAAGGSGSTMQLFFGATSANTVQCRTFGTATVTGDGFYFSMTGEGGNGTTDYRFYKGTGTITDQSATDTSFALWGTPNGNRNNADAPWTTFFTSPTYETAGAPGKAWLTFRLRVIGTTAFYDIKRVGDADFTNVATATIPATATNPVIGYSDQNASQPTDLSWVNDQFVLIDNLVIGTIPSSVSDWTIMN